MKNTVKLLAFFLGAACLAACASTPTQSQTPRKIYLTEQDYLDDLDRAAAAERRAAKPAPESEYIFNVVPETEKAVYFFDERQQPKVPGQPSDADYKREKRLWEKPKRYSPEQYYGMQGGEAQSTGETSYDY